MTSLSPEREALDLLEAALMREAVGPIEKVETGALSVSFEFSMRVGGRTRRVVIPPEWVEDWLASIVPALIEPSRAELNARLSDVLVALASDVEMLAERFPDDKLIV